ncbi:hypothetical protein ACLMJK_008055 [Lecanora helva]
MAVEVALNTPLAEALTNVVQPKLSEVGWSTGGLDDSALGEYIILMLVNGKTQDQIAAELSNDLLNLAPEDTGATEFAKWLFEQVENLNNQTNGIPAPQAQAIPSHLQGASFGGNARQMNDGSETDADMGEAMDGVQNGAIPTGPKSMRDGARNGNKRMIGQISKAMDRSNDAVLHRVRPQQGTERINMHNRAPPKGPRNDINRANRLQTNGRTSGSPHGSIPSGSTATPLMQMTPQQQMQLMAMYEEQARMMSQIFSPQQQQMFMPGATQSAARPTFAAGGQAINPQAGRSLFERVENNPQRQNGQRNGVNGSGSHAKSRNEVSIANDNDISSSMEVESSQNNTNELSPDTTCKFNLKCTKQDCPYAHQSPEAPPGTTIDVNDVCPFGAACKNRKCVGRHPSPAQKLGHQTQQDCKFFPNCTNPKCPFRHPTMPMCRNGADCKAEGCKFTHIKTMCRFNPCLNPTCPYKHAEGQSRGKFGDKVWVAEDAEKRHVSERKFIDDETADEELVLPDVKTEERDQGSQRSSLAAEVVT